LVRCLAVVVEGFSLRNFYKTGNQSRRCDIPFVNGLLEQVAIRIVLFHAVGLPDLPIVILVFSMSRIVAAAGVIERFGDIACFVGLVDLGKGGEFLVDRAVVLELAAFVYIRVEGACGGYAIVR